MRKPGGYAVWASPDGVTKEKDTITCAHCGKLVFVDPPPAPPPGGFCRVEMKPVCGPCADLGRCTPFEKKLEEQERRGRMLAAIGVAS